MEENFVLAADGADFLHRLNHTNLVVDSHDRAQHCVRADGSAERVEVYKAVLLHR